MPSIYLSPSTQQNNLYVTGGSEEQYMNRVADAMVPYLRANGISFTRNSPDMTASQVIRQSNAEAYGLHVALHSNAAPEGRYGQKRGVEVYYFPHSVNGQRAARIVADNFRRIYPNPSEVSIRSTTALGEVDRTRAPSILLEIAYHDNADDANWITQNIPLIARTIVESITAYFDLPFVEPQAPRSGTVATRSGGLNIRSRPATDAPILATAPRGTRVTVYGDAGFGWDSIRYRDVIGFADRRFIR